MISYILRRLVALIPVVLFLSLFVFAILKLTPGDPAAFPIAYDLILTLKILKTIQI